VYQLADTDWLIDHSPPSPYDLIPEPKDKVPFEEQLDYSLLRVKGAPGRDPVGGQNRAPVRNWIRVLAAAYDFPAESIVFIIQHPDGGPLQLAFDPITGLNSNKTRVWYKTNTEGGSSGSPCFNYNWDLIALHHSGDPNWFRPPQYNEGIPFSAILALLKKRGVDTVLGG